VLPLLLELIPTLALGLAIGMRWPLLPGALAQPLVRFGIPLSVAALLLRSGLNRDFLQAGALALLLIAALMLLLQRWPRLLPSGVLQLGAVTGNTTYFGIPVALALLPPQALGAAIAYDLAGTLLSWTLGPRLVAAAGQGRRSFRRDLGQSPATHGFLLAFVLQLTPWQAPLAALLWWPARLVLLLALLLVGMRLGVMLNQGEIQPGFNWRPLAPALLFKMLLLPLLFAILGRLLALPAGVADALVLQAAAPTAISVLLMAEAEGEGVNAAAGLVLISTAMALITVPLWWWLLS
jgi:predicted permease